MGEEQRRKRKSAGSINPGPSRIGFPTKARPSRQCCKRRTTHGLTQVPKRQARRAIQSPTGRPGRGGTAPVSDSSPPLRSKRSLRFPALFRTASPTERPGQSTTSDSDPHLQLGDAPNSFSLLFSNWRIQSRLGLTDRGRPLGKDQRADGESKTGCTSQTMIPGTVPCTPVEIVLCNLPNTNSVVGTDIFPYSIVGVINSHTVSLPPHASEHRQCCRGQDLPYRVNVVQLLTCL